MKHFSTILLAAVLLYGGFAAYAANYIAYVGTTDVSAGSDGQTVALPISVRVHTEPLVEGHPLVQVILQYRNPDSGAWVTLKNYENVTWSLNFEPRQIAFGRETINRTLYTAGQTIRIRLYVKDDIGTENGSLAVDTTEEGTNGWSDLCVWGGTVATGSRPEWVVVTGDEVPSGTITDESGNPLTTEDGDYILADTGG